MNWLTDEIKDYGKELARRTDVGRQVIFIDTGAILSALRRDDLDITSLLEDQLIGTRLITSSHVVTETARRLIKAKVGNAQVNMQTAIAFLRDWLVERDVRVLCVPDEIFGAAKRVLIEQHYIGCDLCDAISFVVVRAISQERIISRDGNFRDLGLQLLP